MLLITDSKVLNSMHLYHV